MADPMEFSSNLAWFRASQQTFVDNNSLLIYRTWSMGQAHVVVTGGTTVRVVALWCIDVVLVDIPEFLIHGIVVDGFALVRLFLTLKFTRAHQLLMRLVGNHGVAPPEVDRA
ncbi:indole-3-glycerol phosphate synthase [Striga asiatica]|uniref:Indole-3-glycerol phosphate synthase n=1 Tax=Striga asiatica TaxID=4170 RepID=A0A5A7QWI0_STRAF|nr:indole-3-glycerol phosphate synthase [Striga asiatica]